MYTVDGGASLHLKESLSSCRNVFVSASSGNVCSATEAKVYIHELGTSRAREVVGSGIVLWDDYVMWWQPRKRPN